MTDQELLKSKQDELAKLLKEKESRKMDKQLMKQREECWRQWQDGAITFVEMCYWLIGSITPQEQLEHDLYQAQLAAEPFADFMLEVEALIQRNK